MNGLIRPRITRSTGCSGLYSEGPKSSEIHPLSFQKSSFHDADEPIDDRFRLQLRQARPGRYAFYDICLRHEIIR